MRNVGFSLAILLATAGVLRAEPLDFHYVAADAKWVAHVDFDAVRTSTVAQAGYRQCLDLHKEAIQQRLAKIAEQWKIDPTKDLLDLTFYGTQIKRDSGVLIVHAKVDQQLLLSKVRELPGHVATPYGRYELHTWVPGKVGMHHHPVTGVFYRPQVLVFAATPAEAKAALDVLDGKTPSLAGKPSPLAAEIPAGAMILARAIGLSGAELPSKSPLVKQSESFSVVLGESKGESFFDGTVMVKSKDVAEKIKSVIEGVRSLAALQHGADAEAMKLVDALKVSATNKTVTVRWRAPAAQVCSQVQKAWKRWAEKRSEAKPDGKKSLSESREQGSAEK
jgi:hypothetical protein